MIRPGDPWGSPETAPPDVEIEGGDADLAACVKAACVKGAREHTAAPLVRFHPAADADLARAVGLAPRARREALATALSLDALSVAPGPSPGDDRAGEIVCNMCIVGVVPERLRWATPQVPVEVRIDGARWFAGRATTIVVANGQFHRGNDLVPRGHPGDGRMEVQVYELARRERRLMRARLATGAHVPHPRIRQRSGHRVEIRAGRPLRYELDRRPQPPASELRVEVVPGAYRLLV